jgi:SAM-dependent methyltransferase
MAENGSLLAAVKTSLRHRGAAGTLNRILADPFYRLRDWQFDRKYHVRTAGIIYPDRLDIDDMHKRSAVQYQPVRLHAFSRIMQALPVNHEEFTFIDIGCGKGRAILLASEFAFRRIVGVELSPGLCKVARENIRTYRSSTQRCKHLEVSGIDAAQYRVPAEPAILFFYNPFSEEIMRPVLHHLEKSLREHPRRLYVVLYNPVLDKLIEGSRLLKRDCATGQFSIYRNAT